MRVSGVSRVLTPSTREDVTQRREVPSGLLPREDAHFSRSLNQVRRRHPVRAGPEEDFSEREEPGDQGGTFTQRDPEGSGPRLG